MHPLLARKLIVATLTLSATAAAAAGIGFVASPSAATGYADPSPPVASRGAVAADAGAQTSDIVHSFNFARLIYPSGYGGRGGGRGSAYTDWPDGDRVIISVLRRLLNLDVQTQPFAVALDDPELHRYPFLYAVEVGGLAMGDRHVATLRKYLLSGGFLVIDDFWGNDWGNFEYYIKQVLPEYEIVPMTLEHPIFHTVYDVEELIQVPVVGRGIAGASGAECYGCEAEIYGIFDDKGRLMVMINWNTDIMDAWEHAENPLYPLKFSTYAYELGANFIVYSMTR